MAKVEMDYRKVSPTAMDNWAFDNLTADEYEAFTNIPLKPSKRNKNGVTVDTMVNDRTAMVKWLYENHKDDIVFINAPSENKSGKGGIPLAELQKKRLAEKRAKEANK